MAVVAITKKQLVDDLFLRVTQAKPSSDLEVPRAQIEKIVDISRDEFLSQFLFNSAKNNGHFVDSIYVKEEKELALSAVDNSDELQATVVQPILSIEPNDFGLLRVRLHTKSGDAYVKVHMLDGFTLDLAEEMEFSTADATHPSGYRKGQILYITGLASGQTSTHDIYVEYIESMTGSDTDYSISGSHIKAVTEIAEEIIRRELGIIIVDPVNDGDQNPPEQPRQYAPQRQTRR